MKIISNRQKDAMMLLEIARSSPYAMGFLTLYLQDSTYLSLIMFIYGFPLIDRNQVFLNFNTRCPKFEGFTFFKLLYMSLTSLLISLIYMNMSMTTHDTF